MDQFKWVDALGSHHALNGSNCNTPIPAWTEQTNVIEDKNTLPIMKVLYGPLIHEGQSAKVVIGPIICEPRPNDDWSIVNLETHVKEVTEKIDILENVVNNLEEESNLSESEWKIEIENLTESMEANKNLWEAKLNEATLQLKTDLGKVEKELKSNHVEKLDPNVDVENDSFILENDVRTQISEVRKIASENKEILNEFKQLQVTHKDSFRVI